MKRAWAILSIVPFLVGALPIIGWLTYIPQLMVFNSQYLSLSSPLAINFVLTSIALVLATYPSNITYRIQIALGLIIVAIAVFTFGNANLGPMQHWHFFKETNATMASNSALAFLMTGLALIFLPVTNKRIFGAVVEIAIFMVLLIAVISLSGYSIKMDLLYNWLGNSPMTLSSAITFIVVGINLGLIWRHNPWSGELYHGSEDKRIILLSSIILFVMILAVTMVNFADLFKQQADTTGQTFIQLEKNRAQTFQNEITRAVDEMISLRNDNLIQQGILKAENGDSFAVHDNEQITTPPSAASDVNPLLGLFKSEGFDAVAVYNTDQKIIATLGQFNERADFNIKDKESYGFLNILWNKNWFTQMASDITIGDRKSGLLVVEWPMHNIDKVFRDSEVMGRTGDIIVCTQALDPDKAVCHSSRQNILITIPQKINNKFTPVHYALSGQSGLLQSYDGKAQRVLVAYGPVGKLKMAILVHMDMAEIYEPIIQSLYTFIPVILLAMVLGLVLLRLQVVPLIRRGLNAEKSLKSSNKRLQESEERYALAVRGSNTGLWDWDMVHDTVFYSPYFKGMLGYADVEFENTLAAFKKVVHPDDYDRVFDLIQQHFSNHVPYDVEYRLKRKSGDYHWFHAIGQALWDADGNPVRMAGSLMDVTERKRADQRLAAQYAVTRILAEANNLEEVSVKILQALCERLEWEFGSLWMVDNQANVIRCVGIWHQPFLQAASLVEATTNLETAMGSGMAGRVWETGQQLWIFDVTSDKNFRLRKQAKEAGLHSAFCFPILLQNKVLGVVEFLTRQRQTPDESMLKMMSAINTQISQFIQRKTAENSLKENESYKTAILESASDSIMTINDQGIILSYNPRTSELFDYSPLELKSKNIDLLLPDVSKKLKHLVGKLAAEFIAVRKQGESFPAEITISSMYLSKQNVFVCIVRDITERKKIEKLKNEFVSVVSHELRTPLTSIRGALGLLVGGTIGAFNEKVNKLLDIANSNCERLLMLINDILDIETIEAGKMEFELQPLEITDLIQEAIDTHIIYAEKLGVNIKFAEYEKGLMVSVDPARMLQVLSNLITNAVKFSPTPGQVEIAALQKGDVIRVTVTDHGVGVPESFKGNIFQKFSQADSTAARGQGGTGLGLSICKAIIDKFGGNINYFSKPNIETIFYFDIPKWQKEKTASKELPVPEAQQKILICEDDEDQSAYLQAMLEAAGFVADVAHTVATAKSMLASTEYNALLLDLLLPDQDGIAFIRQLRDAEKTRYLPVIVLSVVAETGRSLLNGEAICVVDWLDKPVDFNKLLKAIDHIKKTAPDQKPRILHVEDNPDTRQIIATLLQEHANIIEAPSLKIAQEKLGEDSFDLVILDLLLPDGNGTELLPLLAKRKLPVIVFSSTELDKDYARYVTQALMKATTSNEHLLNTIKDMIDTGV
jgi:PAS domain S-box-containing protein